MSHYQSTGFDTRIESEQQSNYDNINQQESSPPQPQSSRSLLGFGSREYVSVEEELIPQQSVHWLEALHPSLNRFTGVGIAQMFFSVAYVLVILSITMGCLRSIVAGFQEFHWAIGILLMLLSIAMSVGVFFFSITLMRLGVELIISVFQIREKLNMLANRSSFA